LRLQVHAHEPEGVVDPLPELIQADPVHRGDRQHPPPLQPRLHGLQVFRRHEVDLVQHDERGHVDPVPRQHVDQAVRRHALPYDRVTLSTSRPRPCPFEAPWISPGMSRIWIFAPRCSITPGITVTVVNAYAATSLVASVIWFNSVDFPTLGNPTSPTVACPLF